MAVYLGENEIGVVVPAIVDIAQENITQMQTVDLVETLSRGLYTIATDQEYTQAEEYFQELASAILGEENE